MSSVAEDAAASRAAAVAARVSSPPLDADVGAKNVACARSRVSCL
jgi:hypothetical protein